MALPKYTNKDLPIMVATMLPSAVLVNFFLFGSTYFTHLETLVTATLVTFVMLCIAYLLFGLVAITLRNRLPDEKDLYRRLLISITVFILMTGVYLSLLCRAYDAVHFLGYSYEESGFLNCFITIIVMNVFLTFLNEGVSQFEKYKFNVRETEQLKKEYMQSQLLGLKSQMNPHFLFNGLNTLSSLIQEDADKAEEFLDHMSKVYRYLLRNNEEQFVTLATEIEFTRSYFYLLNARYSDGLLLMVDIDKRYLDHLVPPLTLQMILENIISQNTISRAAPLTVELKTTNKTLQIVNTVQRKVGVNEPADEGLTNIINKFRLLCQHEVLVTVGPSSRVITLPLIPNTENVLA